MSLREPTIAYIAANSLEAHFLRGLLVNCGIEAIVIEGVSQHGETAPAILIDRTDLERVRPIFLDFERRAIERRDATIQKTQPSHPSGDEFLLVTCEECGRQTSFPATQYGLIQNCPQCHAYMDVGEVPFDDWDVAPE
jgi:hypothetical protein